MDINKILIVIVIVLILFLLLIKYWFKYKKFKIALLEPKNIDRDILILLASYEKFIFKEGFTKRVILEYKSKQNIIYRAYYYNVISKVHLYLEIDPSNLTKDINFLFQTRYKNGDFVTYNNSYIEVIENLAINKNIETFPKANIEELYKGHLKHRTRVNDKIIEGRLTVKELIKNRFILDKKSSRRFLKLLKPESKSFEDELNNIDKELEKNFNIKRTKKATKFTIPFIILLFISLFSYSGYYFYNKYINHKNSFLEDKIINTDKELKFFNKRVNRYKKVTLSLSGLNYKNEDSFKDIDLYFKKSKINRVIGNSIDIKDKNIISSCLLNEDIIELYKWHNGIEQILPNIDLYNANNLYKKGKYIVLLGGKNKEGLALNCNNNALYLYNKSSNTPKQKVFYSINHFLKVVSNAYSQGVVYSEQNIIKIDKNRFNKIYLNNLTHVDKDRYKNIIEYIKNRATIYKKFGNRELKLALLNAIDKLNDKTLLKSAMLFMDDKNESVSSRAKKVLLKLDKKESIF